MKINKKILFKLIFTSILIALNIILERFFSYSVWNMSISFSFITIGFAATFLGLPYAIAVGGIGDLLGSLLFPFGPYFPGFTLTNIITSFITGIFLYKNATPIKISLSVILNKIVGTVLLNTIWISILYRGGLSAFPFVLTPRIPQAIILAIIEIIFMNILFAKQSKLRILIEKQIVSVLK